MEAANRLNFLEEYFFSKKLKEIKSLEKAGVDVINLGIGSPDMMPDDTVIDALSTSASQPRNHGYQPYHGTEGLRSEISNWMEQEYGVQLESENEILPLLGSKEGIFYVSMTFLNPGDKVAIPEVGYPAYRAVSQMVGAEIIEYPLDSDWQPRWDDMDRVKEAKLMWMNYPHMPTGARASEEAFEKAVTFAKDNGILLCHDNPYSHVLNEDAKSLLTYDPGFKNVIELHSLSKSHNMAGWRVGWVAGNADHIDKVLTIKSNVDSGMFRGIQDAAKKSLQLDSEFHEKRNEVYRSRQSVAYSILEALDCSYDPSQVGMFVWGKLPNSMDADRFSTSLLKSAGVFITPGHIFGKRGMNYIRVSLCVEESRLLEALERISK